MRRDHQPPGHRVGHRGAGSYLTTEAATELAAPDTPPPVPVDGSGRSGQTFLVDVVVRTGGWQRRAVGSGQDIYAVTAALVAEAVGRILAGETGATGVVSAGALFDAPAFLRALSPHIRLDPPR